MTINHEWLPARDRIAAWVAEDNFDADGRARTSLSEIMAQRGNSELGPESPESA